MAGDGIFAKYQPRYAEQNVITFPGPSGNPKASTSENLAASFAEPSSPTFCQFLIRPNPISFALPDGTKGRVWPSHREGSKIIGDERLWRVNLEELLRKQERRPKTTPWTPTIEALCRPIIVVGRNDSVRGIDDALGVIKGFRVRLCIEAEKELQVLGGGWRLVTCQFRGNEVLLHHNGSVATMKRKAFKELLAGVPKAKHRQCGGCIVLPPGASKKAKDCSFWPHGVVLGSLGNLHSNMCATQR